MDGNLSARTLRRTHPISLGVPTTIVVLMVLVAAGVGRLIDPLFLAYAVVHVVLGVVEGREPRTEEPQTTSRSRPDSTS